MLGVTLRWTGIPTRGSRKTPSCFMLQLWPDEPLGSYADVTFKICSMIRKKIYISADTGMNTVLLLMLSDNIRRIHSNEWQSRKAWHWWQRNRHFDSGWKNGTWRWKRTVEGIGIENKVIIQLLAQITCWWLLNRLLLEHQAIGEFGICPILWCLQGCSYL